MIATLFQHSYSVLRKNSSLRIAPCNITRASRVYNCGKRNSHKTRYMFPYGSGGVTQPRPQGFSLKKWVGHFFKGKALGTSLAVCLGLGDNKLKGGTRGISPLARGTRLQLARCTCARKTTPCVSVLRVLKYTATIKLSSVRSY